MDMGNLNTLTSMLAKSGTGCGYLTDDGLAPWATADTSKDPDQQNQDQNRQVGLL